MEQLYNAIRTMDQFQKFADDNKEKTIYIVGAGMYGEVLGEGMTLLGVPWAGYVDRRGEGSLNGKEIRPYSYVKGIENIVLLISSWQHADSMAGNIKAEGINAESIYAIMDSKLIDIIALTADVPLKGEYTISSYGDADPDKVYMVMEKTAPYEGIFCDICSFLHGFAYAENNSFVPIIDRKYYPSFLYQNIEHISLENAWEYYFEQPGGIALAEVEKDKKNIRRYRIDDSANLKAIGRSLQYSKNMHDDELAKWRRLTHKYIRLNSEMKTRVKNAYSDLFPQSKSEKILGVSVREGYMIEIEARLSHACYRTQPKINVLLADVEAHMVQWKCDKVFLVCELYDTIDVFREKFGENLIVLKRDRRSYDDYLSDLKRGLWVRDNASIEERQKQYITEIYLLAKCNSLLCGWSSGSSMAVMLHDDGFDHVEFYDYGKVII